MSKPNAKPNVKPNSAVKDTLRENLNLAYNGYLCELLRMWGIDNLGYWIKEGKIYDHEDFVISMDDIIFCVENDVSFDVYSEWQQYVCDVSAVGIAFPSLSEWVNGCKRVSKESLERLREMKKNLEDAIEEVKKG